MPVARVTAPHRDGVGVDVPEMAPDVEQDPVQRQAAGHLQAEEVLQLAGGDQHPRPGRESHDDGMGDEVDEGAEPREPHHELDRADHEGQGEGELDVGPGARLGERAQGREQDDRRGGGGPRDELARRAEQRRDDRGHHRRVQPVLRRHPRDRREGHPLGQHHDGAGDRGEDVGPHRVAVDFGPPQQERDEVAPRPAHHRGGSGGPDASCPPARGAASGPGLGAETGTGTPETAAAARRSGIRPGMHGAPSRAKLCAIRLAHVRRSPHSIEETRAAGTEGTMIEALRHCRGVSAAGNHREQVPEAK